ncbi:phage tail tape measure protein [Bosea sp. MMO-172]|uniref:phage tail tape measure protein n=1 Tax=Bosea sp. MMO-172 TaxID=3127885 RepID=UPI00301ACAB1
MGNLTSTLTVKLIDGISGPAKGAAGGLGQINKAQADLAKFKGYREQAARLDEMSRAHDKARGTVKQLASQLIAAENPSKKMQAAYERATQSVDKLGNKMEWQRARVRGAAAELEKMGASARNLTGAENALRASIDKTTAAMKRQEAAAARSHRRREALGNAGALAGGIAAYRGKETAKKAIVSAAEFDIGTRKQREFTDLSKEDQAGLLKQATKIGQDTQFSNLDVVKAQTKAMQGLPSGITGRIKAEVAEGILENVKNYALVMEADLETSAEAIRSYLQATGKDISTKEKALFEANKATNQLVKMAKLGGMSDEDVQSYIKYAVPTGTAAGLTPESMLALGALARRGGLRGDEAGVFMRATASKMANPTKDGLAALNAAGIDYNSFVRMPKSLSADGLQGQFRNSMGLNFTDATRKKLEGVLGNSGLIGDRGKFVTAVTEAISGQMEKTKKGAMKPADRVNVAKAASKFHQMSAQSVDAEALLDAVMGSSMTLAQLNAFLTNKHGGKGAITQKQREEYVASRKELNKTGDDPDFAKRKADEIMAGLGGSLERLKGSVENFYLAIGQANEKLLTFSFDKIGNAIDGISNMSDTAKQAATALGTLAAVGGGLYAFTRFSGMLLGMGGSAAALTGSAAALDASAAALMRAAVAQGAGGVSAGGAAAGGAAAAGAASRWGMLLRGAGVAGIATALYAALYPVREANEKRFENVAPGEVHNQGQNRRKSGNAMMREQFLEERRRLGILPEQGDAAGTQAGTNAADGIAGGIANNAGKIDAAASSIWSKIKAIFGAGVDVPIRPSVSPANPATPGANKQSSVAPVIHNSVRIKTPSGDPNEIASAVSRAIGERTAESLRGAFTDSDYA